MYSQGVGFSRRLPDAPRLLEQAPCSSLNVWNNHFTEMCSSSEAGSYLRLIDCRRRRGGGAASAFAAASCMAMSVEEGIEEGLYLTSLHPVIRPVNRRRNRRRVCGPASAFASLSCRAMSVLPRLIMLVAPSAEPSPLTCQRLVCYCRTTSASNVPCTSRRMC